MPRDASHSVKCMCARRSRREPSMIHRPKSALGIILATMALLMFNPSAACAQSAKSLTVPPKSFEEHGYTAGAAGASNRTWRVRPSTVENVKNFKSDQAGGGPARMNAAVVAIPGEFFPELLSSALAGGQSMADSMLEEPDIHAFVSPAVDAATVAANKAETLLMPAEYAARLLIDHGSQDWRDAIRHVVAPLKLPTLVVGGALTGTSAFR